ncbi:hypothetical protein [Hyphobacterium sp.]|uniref:hypothetical protein n=1 Tax=Hyphobacterium sp. TaxID=2004662 RepID=UPI003B52CC50
MTTRTVEQIDADIATYQARLDKALDPDRAESIRHGDRELKRGAGGAAMVNEIRRRLAELRAERARVAGGHNPARPVRI